jgi:hypothetical protein
LYGLSIPPEYDGNKLYISRAAIADTFIVTA